MGKSHEHDAPNLKTFDLLEEYLVKTSREEIPLVTFDSYGNAVLEYHDAPIRSVTFYETQTEFWRATTDAGPGAYEMGEFSAPHIDAFLGAHNAS